MLADLVKDIDANREKAIQDEMNRSNINYDDATYLVDNWKSEADRDQVILCAEANDVEIQDIGDNDIEAINEAGGVKGILDSSIGIVKYIYNHKMLAYSILLLLDGKPLVYNNIEPNIMNEMINTDSVGSYYNDNLRGNTSYEGCGCKENSCEPTDLLLFSSIS